jgi:cyclophilin family peptidyl-prolyl cis-trans isomerase
MRCGFFKQQQWATRVMAVSLGGVMLSQMAALPLALAEKMGARLSTTKGPIVIEFYEKEAPKTTEHIKSLISSGFYNSPMLWHRVVPGFVIQTGDPTGTGTGGANKTVPLEVDNELTHVDAGIVGMARSAEPNSGSSQFYITLAPQHSLDAKYTVFGRVIQGMDVIHKINQQDAMISMDLINIEDMAVEKEAPQQEHPFWGIFRPAKSKPKSKAGLG